MEELAEADLVKINSPAAKRRILRKIYTDDIVEFNLTEYFLPKYLESDAFNSDIQKNLDMLLDRAIYYNSIPIILEIKERFPEANYIPSYYKAVSSGREYISSILR